MTHAILNIPFKVELRGGAAQVPEQVESVINVPSRFAGYYGQRTRSESFRHLSRRCQRDEQILRMDAIVSYEDYLTAKSVRHLEPPEEIEAFNAQLLLRNRLEWLLELMGMPSPSADDLRQHPELRFPLYQLAHMIRDYPERVNRIWESGLFPKLKLMILPMIAASDDPTTARARSLRQSKPKLWYIGVVRAIEDLDEWHLLQDPSQRLKPMPGHELPVGGAGSQTNPEDCRHIQAG